MASRLQDVILRGTSGARPAATAVAAGTLYFSTDTLSLDRSDGTNWQSMNSAAQEFALSAAFGGTTGWNPGDAVTAYFGNNIGFNPSATVDGGYRLVAPITGTISKVYGQIQVTGTLGTGGVNSTFTIRNVTTATNQDISTTVPMSAAENNFSNTALTLAVTAGDMILFRVVTGTWATNPSAVFGYFVVIFKP